MSRPLYYRDLIKFSAPLVLSSLLLAGCGSGSSGSADLDGGGGTTPPPPAPVSKVEEFDFKMATDWFVSGTPPIHAQFVGGATTDNGNGAWIIPSGKTGVIYFGTPADAVKFGTQDDFDAAVDVAAAKSNATGSNKVDPPFDVEIFVRGTELGWTARPDNKFVEVADNVLEVTLPLTTATQSNGEFEGADEPGEFKVADASWNVVNCGAGEAGARINVGQTYTMSCGANPGNLDLTITEDADYKFRFDATGADKDAPKLTITKVTGGGGGGGEPEPEEDSTIIRIHSITVVASAAGPAGVESVKTIKGIGNLTVDELRRGGDARITRIEIENTGTNGDVGILKFEWTADAQFALAQQNVDIFYSRPEGGVMGTKIVVGGQTFNCVAPPPDSPFGCVATGVPVTPFANGTMTVQNADGSTETITFNGGSGADDVFALSGNAFATTGTPPPAPVVSNSAAHWVEADTLLYTLPAGATRAELLFSPDASIVSSPQGFAGTYQTVALTATTNPQPAFNKQLHGLKAWALPASAVTNAKAIARGQLVAVARDVNGRIVGATRVQTAGALDDLYLAAAYPVPLGVHYDSGTPYVAVWAPTALTTPGVSVNVYDSTTDATAEVFPMTLDPSTGVWSFTGPASWDRKYYTFSLSVYSYAANAIVTNEVTDPYSVSLSMNSLRSQFVNLDDADLKPAGWDTLAPPPLAAPEDSVIYELHVRDFSIDDASVQAADRGKFSAFDAAGTAGRQHLQKLAAAGLTHVHILPAFDIATIDEDPANRVELDDPVEKLCARNPAAANLCVTDSGKTIRRAIEDAIAAQWLERPQQIANWMRALDGFNWGYDPYHFGVPEGSYSTDPDGVQRILEFRRMVKGLNDLGLRTVMDVVYNHTNQSGQNPKSVFDKIVPGYYHRRDNTSGFPTSASCCQDTASEFRMMEKLMVDTGVRWARDYKVSGFRFDLMSMHTLDNITAFQQAVTAVEPSMYIYGEGWNCCGGEDDIRFKSARQANLGGTGIGSFSDRIRDPVRGGGPFDAGEQYVKNQGFVSGWFYDPNALNTGSTADRQALIADTDNIRVWLAGGLATYQLQNAAGLTVSGAGVDYRGQPSGYTKDPQEAINYAEKHDNQTLWDLGSYKHPTGTPLDDRVRAHNVALSLILLGQGVPFIHAGSEMLRSKSGDRDSYDSGDWFNALDWTMSGTKWAQGLPIADKNQAEWPILQAKYQDPTTHPGPAQLQRSFDHAQEMLKIRKSSALFRLRDQAQIDLRVKFYNTGPAQLPGVVAMGINGCTEPGNTPDTGSIMTIFNASDEDRTLPLFGNETWNLHPVLVNSTDAVVKSADHDANGFYVPARTTAVFTRASQVSCAPYAKDIFVRGSFNDWGNPSPTDQYKLQFLGGKDYSLSAPVTLNGGEDTRPAFKIADADWTASTNCGVAGGGSNAVNIGLPFTMTCADGTGDLRLNTTSAGNYTFSLNAASTVNPVLTVTRTSPSNNQVVFLRGLFEDWGTTRPMVWDGESRYSAVVTANPAYASGTQFKVATGDWATLNCGGAPGASGPALNVTLGQPYALACGDGTQNLGITLPGSSDYVFAVDASNQAALQLLVEPKPVTLFVRGGFNDWGLADPMQYLGGNIYRLDRAFPASQTNFKVASEDWATVDCGGATGGLEVVVGTPFQMACGSGTSDVKITPPAAGTYRFKFTKQSATAAELLVTGP
jgi:pullulanase